MLRSVRSGELPDRETGCFFTVPRLKRVGSTYREQMWRFFHAGRWAAWRTNESLPNRDRKRSRQRRPATGWTTTTGVLCCLNAIIILSIQSIFGNKNLQACTLAGLLKPTATPSTRLAWAASQTWHARADFGGWILSSKLHKMFKPFGLDGFIKSTLVKTD